MAEAEDAFETEFDPLPEVQLEGSGFGVQGSAQQPPALPGVESTWFVDLDDADNDNPPPTCHRAQAFTLWLQSSSFDRNCRRAAEHIDQLLADNPFTTLQIVIEPTCDARLTPDRLTSEICETLLATAFRRPTYLDRFYSVSPGRIKGAKRLIVLLPAELRTRAPRKWLNEMLARSTIIWRQSTNDKGPVTSDEEPTMPHALTGAP